MSTPTLAGVVLAAGLGTRLRPLTDLRPKCLCPLGSGTLLDAALERLDTLGMRGPSDVAVNAFHQAGQVEAALGGRAHLSVESPQPLGTAGALGALRDWLDGRAAVVTNADAYLDGPISALVDGWDGWRVRLLVVPDERRGDFGDWRFAGCSLMPDRVLRTIDAVPSGLYERVWRDELARGSVDLVEHPGTFLDCGTPTDYLAANLHRSGGASVIGADAVVVGEVVRSVVWPGSEVRAEERLVEAVRAGALTVHADGT